MDSKRKPSRPKSKRTKGKKPTSKTTATDSSIDASATSDAGNSAAADSFLEPNSLMDNASDSQAPSIDGLGVSDMELVSPLNDDDFCDFDGSDGEELLNALSDDEGMDFALNHFEEEERRQQQKQQQQQQSQGVQEAQFHQIDQAPPPPLRHRCHSDPLLNSFTDGDYFFNVNIHNNGNHGNIDGNGRGNSDDNFGNDNVDATARFEQDTDHTPFHPSIFLTTTAPLPRRSSDGAEAQNKNNFDASDIRTGGDKGNTNNAKPRRKARKNRNLKNMRVIKNGAGAGGEPLFGGYSNSGNNGEEDDGMSDVASACSAPAQLLDSGFFDDPTLKTNIGGGDGKTFTSQGGRRSNSNRSGGGGNREDVYDSRYEDEQQAGHRRRKSAPLVTDFWGDHDNSTAGSSQGDSSYANRGHGNQRQHRNAAAPIKRRKSDPLITLSDFWNNTNHPGGGVGGVAGHHNISGNINHNYSRNQAMGGSGNERPSNATYLQNMANFEQSSQAEQELSNIIAVAREAQDKINRLKALLSGTPPPGILGGYGGLGSGHPTHPAQLLGGNNMGTRFNPMYYPGNYNQFGHAGNGAHVPQMPQNLGMLPGIGHHSMAAHSMPKNIDLSNFDGNALALSAANYATPQSVLNEASSPKGNRGKSSSKKAPDSAKKKRATKKPPAKSPTSSTTPKPAATSKPIPEVPIPKIDPDTLSKLDPETVMASLQAAMEKTKDTQQQLQEWDRANGLPKSHSQTMVNSSRSRKQLAEGVILKKWNGTPLIDLEEKRKLEERERGCSGDGGASASM